MSPIIETVEENNLLANLTGPTESIEPPKEINTEAQIETGENTNISPLSENAIMSEPPETIVFPAEEKEEVSQLQKDIIELAPIMSSAVLHPEERESSSNKLRAKLEDFIAELEELDLEDEKARKQREEQIDFYQNRIIELKSEYEKRIESLEYEKANLMKELE